MDTPNKVIIAALERKIELQANRITALEGVIEVLKNK